MHLAIDHLCYILSVNHSNPSFHANHCAYSAFLHHLTDPLLVCVTGEQDDERKRAAYLYGTYVGQAFQLIDDALDFEGSTAVIGKAPLADLKSGLATAPTLFAAEEFPELVPLIVRKFESPGDVDDALALVTKSRGLERCKQLAQVHIYIILYITLYISYNISYFIICISSRQQI